MVAEDDWRLLNDVEYLKCKYMNPTEGEEITKHVPYLLKELRENLEFKWRIRDAISDINMFMGWNLASKHDIDS